MRTSLHPAVVAIVILVVLAVVGALLYRNLAGTRVDTSSSMSPELKAKILRAYGGGRPPGTPEGKR